MAHSTPDDASRQTNDTDREKDFIAEGKQIENVSVEEPGVDDEGFKMTPAKFLAIASFQLGYMADVFVLSMVASILTVINHDIGPNGSYTWMVTAQTLGAAVMSPAVGRLSDIFGRRNFLLVGNVVSAIGCAVAATAKDVNTVIGASALIGIGSALHQLAWSCLGEVVPKKSRALALAIFQTTLAPSGAFAPIIANAMVLHASWRYAYWLPFALDILALVLVFFFYHPINQYIREEGKTRLQQAMSLDWVGFFLLTSGLVLFLMGITFGGNRFPWASAGTIAPIVVGFALLVALGFWEAYANLDYPLFPPKILRNVRGFTVNVAGVFLLGILYYSTAVLWPIQVTTLYTSEPIALGWYSSALGLAGTVFGPLAGWIFTRVGHARLLFTGFVFALAVLSGAEAVVSPTSHIASTVLVVLIGIFVAAATLASTTMIQLGVSHEYIGVATGLAITARTMGGSIGTAIYSSILNSKVQHYLVPDVAMPLARAGVNPAKIPAIIGALLTGDTTNPAITEQPLDILLIAVNGIKWAYAHSFRVVYLVAIAFGVVGTVCVAFSANVDHLMTSAVDIKLDEGAKIKAHTDTGGGHLHKKGEDE